MDKNTDQTNFWLAWRATCSAADCTDPQLLRKACEATPGCEAVLEDVEGTVQLARDLIDSMNDKFRSFVKRRENDTKRVSEYADEIKGWTRSRQTSDGGPGSEDEPVQKVARKPYNPRVDGCAFTLVEAYLYTNGKGKISGMPFKDYLFEKKATRKGGMSRNLYGYIRNVLQNTCSKKSVGTSTFMLLTGRLPEPSGGDGELLDPYEGKTTDRDDWYSLAPDEQTEVRQVAECIGQYVAGREKEGTWDTDHWIVLYCMFHIIPVSRPAVTVLARRGPSRLAEIFAGVRDGLLAFLRETGFRNRTIAFALQEEVQAFLRDKMAGMDVFRDLERIRESEPEKNATRPENGGAQDL